AQLLRDSCRARSPGAANTGGPSGPSNGRGLMTHELEHRSPGGAAGGTQREMTADLEALRRTSARNLTSIESFVPAATRRPRTWEEYLMASFGLFTRRPLASTMLAGALAPVALLVAPVS